MTEQMVESRMIPLRQMAKKLGISATYLHDIEKGRRNPSNEVYQKMLKEYRAGIKKFFKIVVEPKVIRIKE
jgi:transcriptional regulator with XRE-family HTH domain